MAFHSQFQLFIKNATNSRYPHLVLVFAFWPVGKDRRRGGMMMKCHLERLSIRRLNDLLCGLLQSPALKSTKLKRESEKVSCNLNSNFHPGCGGQPPFVLV